MRRRDFLKGTAAVVVAATLPHRKADPFAGLVKPFHERNVAKLLKPWVKHDHR